MDEKGIAVTKVKLEVSSIDDNKNQEAPLVVFQSRPQPDGRSSVSCKASTADKDFVRGLLVEIAEYLVKAIGSLPADLPEPLDPAGDSWDDYIMTRSLAGEGADYMKNRLPYGKHMVLLNASTNRDGKISGEVNLFQKLEPATDWRHLRQPRRLPILKQC